jgi:hypothetical protein
MRRAALVGAAYHAHDAPYPNAPYFLRPLSLDQVVSHLKSEATPIRLQGAAWLVDGNPPPARKARLLTAIREILGPSLGARSDDLFHEVANEPPAIRRRSTLELSAGSAQSRFAKALSILEGSVRAGCTREQFDLTVAQDPITLVTFAGARVEVQRPPSAFTVMADPQNWINQASLFWKESDRVADASGQFVPIANLPPPGTVNYTDALLHEVVTMSYNPFFPIVGDNILVANYENTTDPYGFEVKLFQCLSTTIGASTEAGGIDVDSGRFAVASIPAKPGWTELTGTKRARFTARELCGFSLGPWLNAFAPFVLGVFMGILVYEGACATTSQS